jgi:hypothetical protein
VDVPLLSARGFVAALAAVSLLGISGCGDDGGESASDPSGGEPSTSEASLTESAATEPSADDGSPSSQPPSSWPECGDVWVAGQDLPGRYQGCVRDGAGIKADKHACSLGTPIVEFDDRFYAVPGNVVNDVGDLSTSKQFRNALTSCQG